MKKIKKILLIWPKTPPTYWSFKYALPFIGKKASIPPLGLLTVAAMMPDKYEVELVDMNVSGLDEKKNFKFVVSVLTMIMGKELFFNIVERFTNTNVSGLDDRKIAEFDMVFISAMIVQKESFASIVAICNRLKVPVVAGGPYPTSSYEKIRGVSHFVLNEAEITLPGFLKDLENGTPKYVYKSDEKADIAKTPLPALELLRIKNYAAMALQYSRGCPFNCEFCDITEMFGHRVRTKTDAQMLKEIKLLYFRGWRGSVFIVDDNFIGNKKKVKSLLPKIAKWQKERDYPFDFFTEASVNLAEDEELLGLMREAGFNMVFLGIETPDKETLASAGKFQNVSGDIQEKTLKIQSYGIEPAGGFIIGFDNDPPDIFKKQVQLIQNSGIVTAMVGLLTALPNTRLYKRLKEEGRLLEDSSGNNTHNFNLNFETIMNRGNVLDGYKKVIKTIYSPKKYFERCLKFLENLNPHQNSARKVRFEEIGAFFRSIIRQTFSSYGHDYLRYIKKAFIMKPAMFPEAISQAIKGDHFFKMAERTLAADNFKNYANSILVQYKKKIRNAYTAIDIDIEKAKEDLRFYRDKLIKDLQKKFKKIHKDFRYLVVDIFNQVVDAINNYYNSYILLLSKSI